MKKQLRRLLIPTLLVATLSACSTSPTGRSQILAYSPSQLNKMGAQSFAEMKQKVPISKDAKVNQFVQCVADAITVNVSKNTYDGQWEVVVFDSEQINAFALPGGKIGVYTGILQVTDDADQLAAIIGHEVGHVIAQHSNERLTNSNLQTGAVILAGALASEDKRMMTMAAVGLGIQYGFVLPYSRTHESEADIIGQELMATSGFKPEASVQLWHNMAKASNGAPPEFLSTHPSHDTRIKNLTNHLQVSDPIYAQRSTTPTCKKPVIKPPAKQSKQS
ncbi:M48 family metallopeptidase [Thalassotalea ponticola]|uniref:M48 family metallopeptidase n=1 Tax=Thalassotalea ponticola TaxID=1523392 RepID=UPI0025B43A8F|nr:M48 family metallopeptidase [Thalassotalea ponticola]MDN3651416.1 M48 family metallopeptidase [Thalassotalea ponticola]